MIRSRPVSYCRSESRKIHTSVGRLAIAPVVAGAIHIEIGRTRIRVEGPVDPATLRTILEQLGR
jgi:hypothetical protein